MGSIPALNETERKLRLFFRRWYRTHGRSFRWRTSDTTPFGVVIAEMLLRQTRAEMVADVWPLFMDSYPTPESCLSAPKDDLLEMLACLGLKRQRVDAIQTLSQALVDQHHGNVPRVISRLLELPHVGLYTSHAVACFAFGQRVPIVDANILRVFSRITGTAFTKDNRRNPGAWEIAARILPSRNVREHNYGLLDFSAQICKPIGPDHDRCALKAICIEFQKSKTADDTLET